MPGFRRAQRRCPAGRAATSHDWIPGPWPHLLILTSLDGPFGPDLGTGNENPNLIDEAKRPIALGAQRIDHGMPADPEVPLRVSLRRFLAAADVAARTADPKPSPRRATRHARLAYETGGSRASDALRDSEVPASQLAF